MEYCDDCHGLITTSGCNCPESMRLYLDVGDRMQPQEANPDPDTERWESEGGHSGLRARDNSQEPRSES